MRTGNRTIASRAATGEDAVNPAPPPCMKPFEAFSSKYRFPWRPGNRFELLIDGQEYFPRMIESIRLAQSHVWLEIYLFESGQVADRMIDALTEAAQRGVEVCVLTDAYGATALHEADRARLRAAGVRLALFNPLKWRKWFGNLFRDHRKLLIVDGRTAFVSGTGITDEFDDAQRPARSWRETTLRITGPVMADWESLFVEEWNRHDPHPIAALTRPPEPAPDGFTGRVVIGAGLRSQELRRSLYRYVRAARERIWIATAYFVPSRKLMRALVRAARRGVDVRLLLPGPHTDHPGVRHAGRRFYMRLLRAGARVYEYQPRFLHAKSVLCDDWASVGSSNFDRWNLRWNLEANQEVDDPAFAGAMRAMFESDFADSREILLDEWRQRGLPEKVREQVWGRIDMLLDSLGRMRGMRMK